MADIFDFDGTAASNTAINGVNCNTGMSPANLDNCIRELMAACRNTFATGLENFLKGTAGLGIANGGTGATTAAAALTALGGLETTYRDLPVTSKSAAFTFSNTERGGLILYSGAAAAATINPNATTAINTGAVFVINNAGSGTLTLTRGAGVTLYVNGSTTSANGSLAVGGCCTLIKRATDTWVVTGSNLS